MNRTVKRFLSPPMIVALIALVLAIGAPAYALSITSAQIKNNTITSADVKNSSLTGVDVKNRSLTGGDIKAGTVSGSELKDSSVTGIDIGNNSVTGIDIADGTLGSADIAELSGSKIWPGSIFGNTFASGTIDGGRLAPSAKGARSVSTFYGNCEGYANRGLGACAHDSAGVYRLLAVSTEVDLTKTWPLCEIGGNPATASGWQCGASVNNTTLSVWVVNGMGSPVDPTAANPVVLVLP